MGHVTVIKDYRLTTVEILYHLPDHPALLQTYVWQAMDIAPEYPDPRKFLAFWRTELEGKLHSVRVAANPLARTGRVRHAKAMHTLH
ncbi:MAG: Usg family protein [Acetobacteraceae bacterium]|nr:Usg family protein [Acetobacteraceae bacterium]